MKDIIKQHLGQRRGATIVLVAVVMIFLIVFIALAIDITHLYVARNELQNAADAAALAGANLLYQYDEGTGDVSIQPDDAVTQATETAGENKSEKSDIQAGNVTVEVGHWSFGWGDKPRGFTEVADPTVPVLAEKSAKDLDEDLTFANAVHVTVSSGEGGVKAFFARIFGYESFTMSADAVAYLGFAASVEPHMVTLPLALCKEYIQTGEDDYTCTIGRLISSNDTINAGGWTDFDQLTPCKSTNANDIANLLKESLPCEGLNPRPINGGKNMSITNGTLAGIFKKYIYDACWNKSFKGKLWEVTLPVIDCCEGGTKCQVNGCKEVIGIATVKIIWMIDSYNKAKFDNEAPRSITDEDGVVIWSSNNPKGMNRWNDLVNTFHLKDTNGNPAQPMNQTMYFIPECEVTAPIGGSGEYNMGKLADFSLLVE